MPRAEKMSWEGAPYFRWVKMKGGARYRVSCEELGTNDRTRQGTYQLANAWWETKLAELAPKKGHLERQVERKIAWAEQHDPSLSQDLKTKRSAGFVIEDAREIMALRRHLMEDFGWDIPFDPATGEGADIIRDVLGESGEWGERFAQQTSVAADEKVTTCADAFLAVKLQQVKPKTWKELADVLAMVKEWWATLAVSAIDERQVEAAWQKVAAQAVEPGTKIKRWNIVKAFVTYLAESGKIDQPRNLHSRLLSFKRKAVKVQTWTTEAVRAALAGLPTRFRLYAMLGLNCGMTNVDISALRKSDIKDGYLTRRRVKTGDNANVPTVTYRLWTDTVALLNEFKSEDPDLWFTSSTGTALVTSRIENGKAKVKDLIYLAWKRQVECEMPLCKFRSIAANLLETSALYGRYADLFLSHSPKSLKEKHYAVVAQVPFDEALTWLHSQLFPKKAK